MSAADEATIAQQISSNQIKDLRLQQPEQHPDVAAQVTAAKNEAIPVVAVTETLTPASSYGPMVRMAMGEARAS